jgi:hypothetical protein
MRVWWVLGEFVGMWHDEALWRQAGFIMWADSMILLAGLLNAAEFDDRHSLVVP